MAARDLCDAEGCLTEDGLGVDAALPGEHPVGADELPPEFDGLGYDLNAGSGHGAQILEEGEPEAAGGSGSRTIRSSTTEC
jgi:hypothetical protein